MMGAALIVFREVLEAALIVAIVMGATRGVAGRGRWVAGGIAVGLLGAAVVAGFAGSIAGALDGRGQELLNAGVLLAAVAMLAWHNIWMSTHGREIAQRMRAVGHDVSVGAKPLSALALVTMFAVLREGSETVLFLYGIASGGASAAGLLTGGLIGVAAGVALGWVLYRGLLAIPLGRFMTVIGWLVLLLAAGLAASAAGFLNQAGLVPAFGMRLWDSSWILDQRSWLGTLLHILIGYNDRPMGVQAIFYVVTLVVIGTLMWAFRRGAGHRPRSAGQAAE
jgi:high-affinity iron transporter